MSDLTPANGNTIVEKMLKEPESSPDLIIDGLHFGRGDNYFDEIASKQYKYKTTHVKCWKIVNEKLEEIITKSIHNFYDNASYIVEWNSITEVYYGNQLLHKNTNKIYFYWKGENASKGYSPLPFEDDVPVVRITQWAEPPAFLQLFSGKFVVRKGDVPGESPHLFILRGEVEKEVHLLEVPLRRESLRSRTCFVLSQSEKACLLIWHGAKSNARCRNLIKYATQQIFGPDFIEISEGAEIEIFSKTLIGEDYFRISAEKIVDHTPRLFYFNKITGNFLATEIESSHKSCYLTPLPFLQTHLYSATQPAIFLLDDGDEIWIWQGWQCDNNEDKSFKTDSFITAINYGKEKSKIMQKLVRVQKVLAGFEPIQFTNLFPTWNKRDDIAQLQMKEGVLENTNPLLQLISHEGITTTKYATTNTPPKGWWHTHCLLYRMFMNFFCKCQHNFEKNPSFA